MTPRRERVSRLSARSRESVARWLTNARPLLLISAMALILSSPVAGANPASTQPTPLPPDRDPCAAFTEDATYVSLSLMSHGGTDWKTDWEESAIPLRVPEQFIEDPSYHQEGSADYALLFRVWIGTFLPVGREDRNKPDFRHWMAFVVGDNTVPLEELAVSRVESHSGERGRPWGRGLDSYKPVPGPFGLAEIRSDVLQETQVFQANTYIARREDGTLSAVLSCNAEHAVADPECHHWFRAAGADVSLEYRRSELPNWRALQKDVTTFLTCTTRTEL